MHHTKFTDYSLRVLMCLAVRRDELTTIDSISTIYGISKNHLMKVVYHLGVEGFIETTRGRNGGIRLKADPRDIVVGDVVRKMEDDFHLVECYNSAKNKCILTDVCRLGPMMGEALNAYLDVLDKYTLADLLVEDDRFEKLIGVAR